MAHRVEEIPATIADSLMARLDRLGAAGASVSAAGRQYWDANFRIRCSPQLSDCRNRRCATGWRDWMRRRSCSCAANRRSPVTPSSIR